MISMIKRIVIPIKSLLFFLRGLFYFLIESPIILAINILFIMFPLLYLDYLIDEKYRNDFLFALFSAYLLSFVFSPFFVSQNKSWMAIFSIKISAMLTIFGFYYIYMTHGIKCNGKLPELEFDYLYFSTITFTTIGYGDCLPVSKEAKTAVMIQSMIGYLYLGAVTSLMFKILIDRNNSK